MWQSGAGRYRYQCFYQEFQNTRHTVHGRGAKTPGIWSLNFFRKKFQKIVQILFKILFVYHWGRNFDTFFSKLPKSVFQTLIVERHVSTPHILLVKITKIRTNQLTNWLTNTRNICFWLADERKERFAQKSAQNNSVYHFWELSVISNVVRD